MAVSFMVYIHFEGIQGSKNYFLFPAVLLCLLLFIVKVLES